MQACALGVVSGQVEEPLADLPGQPEEAERPLPGDLLPVVLEPVARVVLQLVV